MGVRLRTFFPMGGVGVGAGGDCLVVFLSISRIEFEFESLYLFYWRKMFVFVD